jgi:2-polyprenyl-3-methyl-5-hydroxy-6-metoxy-1,4-benzoquinol methylase
MTPSAMATLAPCSLCGGTDYAQLHDMQWRRVVRCRGCGLVRADPLPSLDEKRDIETRGYVEEAADFPEVADLYANCTRNFVEDDGIRTMRAYLAQLERELGGPGTLLDIGAGTGIFMHLARERGWDAHGVDISPVTAEKAAAEFDLAITVAPFETHHFDGRRFDAVSMLDVLEHVVDPMASLRRVHELLRPGGAVQIAVPNENSLLTRLVDVYARAGGPAAQKLLARLYVPPHLHYFTPRTLRRMLETAGFRVRRLAQEQVDLSRYRMSAKMRVPLQTVLTAGALVGMNARLGVLATR